MSLRLVQGHAAYLPLADQSVHCVVTSPPYWGLRDYGTAVWEGGEATCTHPVRTGDTQAKQRASSTLTGGKATVGHHEEGYKHHCARCGAIRHDEQIGLESTPELYVQHLVEVFREVYHVLRNDGVLCCNIGDTYSRDPQKGDNSGWGKHADYLQELEVPWHARPRPQGLPAKNLLGIPWRLAFALQADGWILRSEIIWHKTNCMPESVQDRPTRAHEQVFLFAKQARYYYDAEAVAERAAQPTGVPRETGQHASKLTGNHSGTLGTNQGMPTRNLRSVWPVPSQPFSGAHFACFPEALVRPCILAATSAYGCCAACGAPYRRVVERGGLAGEGIVQHGVRPAADVRRVSQTSLLRTNGRTFRKTLEHGWIRTCRCPTDAVVPCTVLDPFAGAGTTLLVARALGRHGVGVDLSLPYLRLARERLGLAALAAWEHGAQPVVESYDDLPLWGGARE